MKIAFLTSNPNASLIEPVSVAFERKGIKTEIIDTNKNLSRVKENYDLVIVRLLKPGYLYLVQLLEEQGIKVINPFTALSICSNKMLSTLIMKKAGLKIPKTALISGGEIELVKNFNFPVVVKPIFGRSSGIEYIERVNDLKNKNIDMDDVFLQEYINGDLIRIYKIGPFIKAYLCKEKHVETTVPERIIKQTSECFERIGMEIGGMDCIKSKNSYYFIDINDMPAGIKHFENLVEILIKYLESVLRRMKGKYGALESRNYDTVSTLQKEV